MKKSEVMKLAKELIADGEETKASETRLSNYLYGKLLEHYGKRLLALCEKKEAK